MLRNRNSFFPDTNINNMNGMPQPIGNYNMPNNQNMYGTSPMMQPMNNEDIDSRIAKLERQINRLDNRITKLENASKIVNDDISSSMYMM
jgi:hypothetical protein